MVGASQESRLAIVIDVGDAERRIRRLREQLRELGQQSDDTGRNTDDLGRRVRGASEESSKLSKVLGGLTKFSKVGGLALTGIGAAAIKVSGDFEESMNGVRAVSGAVGEDFNQMRELAKKMGSETAFSATEAANGMEYLAMAGMNTEQILATIPNALDLAAAGSIDLAQSADILSNIMSGMGIAAEDSARAADVLAATAAGANTDIASLGEAMKYAAPVAKTMGYSLEETAAAAGILGNAGIAAGQAGTSLRSIMSRIAADKGAKTTLDSLGVSATDSSGKMRSLTDILSDLQVATADLSSEQQIEIFKKIAGTEGMGALAVLVDGVANDSLPQLIEKLKESEGAAKEMAAIRMEGLNGAIKGAKSAAEGFLIALGDAGLLDLAARGVTALADGIRALTEWLPTATADITAFFQSAEVATAAEMAMSALKTAWDNLVSVIRAAGDVIAPVIDFFREHDKLSEALAISIGLVAGAFVIYNAAVAIGTAVTGGFVAVLALLTSPITLTIAALVAITAVAIYVYQNWEKIVDVMNDFADVVVGAVVDGFNSAVDAANDFADGVVNYVVDGFNNAVSAANDFADGVVGFVLDGFNRSVQAAQSFAQGLWASISQVFDTVVQFIAGRIDNIQSNFKSGLAVVINIAKGAFDVVKTVVKTALDVIKAIIKGDFSAIPNIIKGGLQTAASIVTNMMGNILDIIKNYGKRLYSIGRDFIQGFINGIKSIGSDVVSAASTMAGNAIEAVRKRQQSNSPAKATIKLGKDFGDGYIGGIKLKTKAVKTEAQKMAEGAVKAVQDGVANLKREIALFGSDSIVDALKYDINVGKFGGADTSQLMSLTQTKEQLELSKKLADANKSVQDSIDELLKQKALFGNSSSLASLMYDIEHTDKYKDATKELTDELIKQARALEQLSMTAKATAAIQARFDKFNQDKASSSTNLQGMLSGIEQETPLGKIQADYEARLELIEQYENTHTDMLETAKEARLAVEQSYMDAKRDLMLTQSEALFGDLAGLAKGFAGEQSGIYKALFAVEKGFAIAQSAIAIQQSIAKAMAVGFPANIPLIGQAVSQGASIMSNIQGITPKGFKQGGYTGNMGTSQVAGVVHGQEYVFDAQSTKRIGVDNLNAMRRGDKVGGDVNINVVVDAKGNASMSGDQGHDMGRKMAQGIKALVIDTMQKEKRQGGLLYG